MERQTCSCGTRLEEWDPEQGGHPQAYSGHIGTCPGCREIQLTRERANDEHAEAKGVTISLRRQSKKQLKALPARPRPNLRRKR